MRKSSVDYYTRSMQHLNDCFVSLRWIFQGHYQTYKHSWKPCCARIAIFFSLNWVCVTNLEFGAKKVVCA